MKKIIVISMGHLQSDGSAGTSITCGIIDVFLRNEYLVDYYGFVKDSEKNIEFNPFIFSKNAKNLTNNIILFKVKKTNRFIKIFNSYNHSIGVEIDKKNIENLKNNYKFGFVFESLPAVFSKNINIEKKLIIFGDPMYMKLLHSSNVLNVFTRIKSIFFKYAEFNFIKKTAKNSAIAMFGTMHAKELSRFLNKKVLDIRPFLSFNFSLDIFLKNNNISKEYIFNFGGTLASTASKNAFKNIENQVIPALENILNNKNYKIRILGKVNKNFLEQFKKYKNIQILGRVDNFELELSKAPFFLLPMNYPVGVRTRVCSALAAGNICIVHKSVLINMPELIDCKSVFFISKNKDYKKVFSSIMNIKDIELYREYSKKFFKDNYFNLNSAKKILFYYEGDL